MNPVHGHLQFMLIIPHISIVPDGPGSNRQKKKGGHSKLIPLDKMKKKQLDIFIFPYT